MRVLVTRPRISAEKTGKRLETLGHEAVLLPLFEPQHDVAAVRAAVARPAAALIVTSAEAIRAVVAAGPIADTLRETPVFTVGDKTAAAAKAAGFANVEAASGSGASLAELVTSKTGIGQGPLVYLAGEPRAPALEGRLAGAGVALSVAVVYRMHPIAIAPEQLRAIVNSRVDAILFFSAETAHRFFELTAVMAALGEHGTRLLCLSPEIAKSVPRQFDRYVEIAKMPSEASLLELL